MSKAQRKLAEDQEQGFQAQRAGGVSSEQETLILSLSHAEAHE
jgi:hypothetical protein